MCEAPGTDRRLVGPFRQKVPVPFSPILRQTVVSRLSATCFLVASSAERLLRVVSSLSGSWRQSILSVMAARTSTRRALGGMPQRVLDSAGQTNQEKATVRATHQRADAGLFPPLGIRLAGMKAASESHHRSFDATHFEKVCRLGGRVRGNGSWRLERSLGIARPISRDNSREPTAPGGRPQSQHIPGGVGLPAIPRLYNIGYPRCNKQHSPRCPYCSV